MISMVIQRWTLWTSSITNCPPEDDLSPCQSLTDEVDAVLWSPQLLDQMLHILLQRTDTGHYSYHGYRGEPSQDAGLNMVTEDSRVRGRVCTLVGLRKQMAFRCFMLSLFWESMRSNR